jgi:tetratricopeptide (TPR) repeat protein
MDRRRLPALLISAALAAGSGCSLFQEEHKPQYETVQADPRHDTAVAEAEHAQALKILNEPSCCTGCNPCKAEEHLQKALVADVTYGPAHNTLGMLYLRQRKLYLAAWEFEYAQRLMSDRFEPVYNLGLVYEAADKLDRAVEFYSMAFSLSPRTPDVLEGLARARLRNGEPLASVRPLLKEILLYETRPAWVC